MLFGSSSIREEVEKQGNIISTQLNNIKANIPYQSDLEKEYNKLLDCNVKFKKDKERLENTLLTLQETNEKLLKYIEDIEEVKNAGGIKCCYFESFNGVDVVKFEKKKIPSIEICRIVGSEE